MTAPNEVGLDSGIELTSENLTTIEDCTFTYSKQTSLIKPKKKSSVTVADIAVDHTRDNHLTDFGKATMRDSYLLDGETPQLLFARVCSTFADDKEHANRLYGYMSNLWFMAATPVLSNGGTERGYPISCFVGDVQDSLESIIGSWNENAWLAARGGGVGTYWGNVREVGHAVGKKGKANGKTSGIVPFIKVQESVTLAISQGSLRRGNAAIYLPVWHPEIEEFIQIRKVTGGDVERKAIHIQNAVVIDDHFMECVRDDKLYALRSPADGSVIKRVSARDLWARILTRRIEDGEPYLLFVDNINKHIPEHHKQLGLKVKTSNLCSEITLPTGLDHRGKHRTAVCCLSSLNLDKWDEWKNDELFIEDIMRFLDNVLQNFIDNCSDQLERARYSAMRERSVGLGVMGFHALLQQKMIPFESPMAKGLNLQIFRHINKGVKAASCKLAIERGACPDAQEVGMLERFSNRTAVAPTASISIICGETSAGIEPRAANAYLHKTKTGSFPIRNHYLKKVLAKYHRDDEETWSSISLNKGSVQHLDFLTDVEREVFKTAYELDNRWIIELAADRAPLIDQSQSVNLFLTADVSKSMVHYLHYMAWKKGLKSLYYCRSLAAQRAENASKRIALDERKLDLNEECLSCQ